MSRRKPTNQLSVQARRSRLAEFEQTAGRQRRQCFQLERVRFVLHGQTNLAVRRDRPKISGLVRNTELVAWMVLRKPAILVRVRAAPRTGAQVRD